MRTPGKIGLAAGMSATMAALWFPYILEAADRFAINTPRRLAMFLAQCSHESRGFTRLSENLNYSAEGLRSTWPKRFDAETAAEYARQPERIANKVYANRYGNGDEASGDGWKYRGQGPIQVTFKDNHRACGEAIGYDLVAHPELLATDPRAGALSAGWFWSRNNLNALADAGDVEGVTRRINGGAHGIEDRRVRYAKAKSALGVA